MYVYIYIYIYIYTYTYIYVPRLVGGGLGPGYRMSDIVSQHMITQMLLDISMYIHCKHIN